MPAPCTDRDPNPDRPLPFTRYALQDRGADYFTRTQTPREEWKTLDDLAPQLAEFELRCQGGDYDTAAQTLLAIDIDYLIQWGHYRHTIELHNRLQHHLTDPTNRTASLIDLGWCHYVLGDYPHAIQYSEHALTIARENDDRQGEADALGNLGLCYVDLGQTQHAIQLHEQALTLARETGDRRTETRCLNNLSLCNAELGQIRSAIQLSEQALTIDREIGSRLGEAADLNNLGLCNAELGRTQHAIQLCEQALIIAREIGERQGEATCLNNLGLCYADLAQWQPATGHLRQAIEIADTISNAQVQAEARRDLAQTQLWAGDLSGARQTIDTARNHDYPPAQAGIALLDGILHLHHHEPIPAAHALHAAIARTEERLHHNPDDYAALDTKALTLTALTLTTTDTSNSASTADALAAFRAARALTNAPGITA